MADPTLPEELTADNDADFGQFAASGFRKGQARIRRLFERIHFDTFYQQGYTGARSSIEVAAADALVHERPIAPQPLQPQPLPQPSRLRSRGPHSAPIILPTQPQPQQLPPPPQQPQLQPLPPHWLNSGPRSAPAVLPDQAPTVTIYPPQLHRHVTTQPAQTQQQANVVAPEAHKQPRRPDPHPLNVSNGQASGPQNNAYPVPHQSQSQRSRPRKGSSSESDSSESDPDRAQEKPKEGLFKVPRPRNETIDTTNSRQIHNSISEQRKKRHATDNSPEQNPAPAPKKRKADQALTGSSQSTAPNASYSLPKPLPVLDDGCLSWTDEKKEAIQNAMAWVVYEQKCFTEARWEMVENYAEEVYQIIISRSVCRNYWFRYGRAATGIDERKNPRPDQMVTGVEDPAKRKQKRLEKKEAMKRKREVGNDDEAAHARQPEPKKPKLMAFEEYVRPKPSKRKPAPYVYNGDDDDDEDDEDLQPRSRKRKPNSYAEDNEDTWPKSRNDRPDRYTYDDNGDEDEEDMRPKSRRRDPNPYIYDKNDDEDDEDVRPRSRKRKPSPCADTDADIAEDLWQKSKKRKPDPYADTDEDYEEDIWQNSRTSRPTPYTGADEVDEGDEEDDVRPKSKKRRPNPYDATDYNETVQTKPEKRKPDLYKTDNQARAVQKYSRKSTPNPSKMNQEATDVQPAQRQRGLITFEDYEDYKYAPPQLRGRRR